MGESEGRTDAELLSAVAEGDSAALRQIYERHAPWVSVRLTRRCNDPEAVADVLHALWAMVTTPDGMTRVAPTP